METTLQPHKLGQLLDHSFRMTLKNYSRFLIPVALYSAVTTGLMEYMFTANSEFFSAASASPQMTENLLSSFKGGPYFLSLLLIILISPLFQFVVNDIAVKSFFLREDDWHLPSSLKKGLERFVPILLATLLSSLIIMGGFLVLIVGALIAALFLSLLYPVLIYEECSPRESLRRSFLLIRGEFFQMAGYWIVFWLIFIGMDMISSQLVEWILRLFLKNSTGLTSTILYYVLSLPVVILSIGLQSCFAVNMYFNQRIKREGFGLE